MRLSFLVVCMLSVCFARADLYYDFENAATTPVWTGTTQMIQSTSASHQGTNAIAFAGGPENAYLLTELPQGTTNVEFYFYDDYGPNPPLYRYMFLRLLEQAEITSSFAGFSMLDGGFGTTPPMTKNHYYGWANEEYSLRNMGPIRTVGWHKFTFAVGPESVVMSVDGTLILQTNMTRTARYLQLSWGLGGGWGRMDDLYVSTSFRAYIGGQIVTGTNVASRGPATITLETGFANGTVVYSLDGSDPRSSATLYTKPIAVGTSAILRAVAYNSSFTASVEMDPVQVTILPTLMASTAGGGTVSITPPSGAYLSNSIAHLTAQPAPGWVFLQWLGDATGTNPLTHVQVTRDKCVEAVFGTSVGSVVVGAGAVSADPPVPLYPFGTTIKFTAQPQAGNYFAQWGASASGTNNPLSFVVSTPSPSIAGVFSTLGGSRHALTVLEDGRGHVLRNPLDNSCTNGQPVTLTALPDWGQDFIGWSGGASGAENPLPLSLTASKVITAHFTSKPSLSVSSSKEWLSVEGCRVRLSGEFGAAYQIDWSTNLADWTLLSVLTNTFGTVEFTDTSATNAPSQFYRAQAQSWQRASGLGNSTRN